MLYTGKNAVLPHVLFYSWTGWPEEGSSFSGTLSDAQSSVLGDAWAGDRMRLHAFAMDANQVKATFSVEPHVSPVFCASRAKGRLQHALRQAGLPCAFSRKVGLRALGRNITPTVVDYVRNQLAHVDLADPRYIRTLADSSYDDSTVNLDQPIERNRSRYWYNIHLVFVTAARYRIGERRLLSSLRDTALRAARDLHCRMRSLSIMPDHVHVALQGDPEQSPLALGLAIQNATARAAGCRLWQDKFYVGTFSAYDLNAIPQRSPPPWRGRFAPHPLAGWGREVERGSLW